MVRKERLELSRRKTLEPKSSASTNSATFAVSIFGNETFCLGKMGWAKGIEPSTAGITILSSTD